MDARGGFSALGNNFANAVDEKDIMAAQERRIDGLNAFLNAGPSV